MSLRITSRNWHSSVLCVAVAIAGAAVASDTIAQSKAEKQREERNEERSENRDFLKKAYQAGLAEIEISRLGREEARNEDVKKFPSMMVIDHQKANKEIEEIAEARNMTLNKNLADDDDKRRDRLAKLKGAEFDKAFVAAQVEMHNEAIRMFVEAEKDSKDPKVDAFVKNTLPKLREHHAKAQSLRDDLK